VYRLSLFGGLTLSHTDGTPAVDDALQRRLLVLALAVESGARGLPRDRAIALLWPEADEERGRGSLNQLRYTLRRQLDAELLIGTLVLRTDPALLTSDIGDFRDAIAAGDADRASALYRGPFLDAVPLGGSAELDEWADSCRREAKRQLEELLLRSARTLTGAAAVDRWGRLAQLDPFDETYAAGLASAMDQVRSSALAARQTPPPAAATADSVVTPAGPRRGRFPVYGLLIGLAGAVAAIIITTWRPAIRPAPTSAVAVMPFTVRGASEYRYLGEGMVTLLSAELSGIRAVRPVDGRAVLSEVKRKPAALESLDGASDVAGKVGAGVFVLGDLVEANGRLRISATAYRTADRTLLAEARAAGPPAALFELVDSIASGLLTALGGGSDARLTRLAASTTGSLPALKQFLDGEKLFREGRFLEANDAFRQAAADTGFALAQYWLSVSGWWSDQSDIIRPAADLAVRHADRLSPRDRLLLEAWDTLLRGDARESERRYRAVLGVEPENVHASTQLGEVIFHYGPRQGIPMTQARESFERVLAVEPADVGAMIHLARIAAREHRGTEMLRLVDRILAIDSVGEWALEARTLRAFAEAGNRADERWALEHLARASDGRIWNEALYAWLAAGNRNGAQKIVTLLTAPGRAAEVRSFGHAALAWLDVADGKVTEAFRQLDESARLDSVTGLEHRGLILALPFVPRDTAALLTTRARLERWNPVLEGARRGASHVGGVHDDSHVALRDYLIGTLAVRMGDLAAAEDAARRLDRIAATGDVADYARRAGVSVRAQVLLARGQADSTVTILARSLATETSLARMGASPFYSRGLERFLLARALEALGRPQDAAQWDATFHGQPLFDIVFYRATDAGSRVVERSSSPARN
jgi:DNA-binding SARP family transcriptional activator